MILDETDHGHKELKRLLDEEVTEERWNEHLVRGTFSLVSSQPSVHAKLIGGTSLGSPFSSAGGGSTFMPIIMVGG